MEQQIVATSEPMVAGLPAPPPFAEPSAEVREPTAARVPDASRIDSLDMVRSIIRARSMRRQAFAADLFADPAWDMLLELYAIKCEDRRISISKLSFAAGVPSTTALRWIDKLEVEGLVVRTEDPMDARRVWIALSPSGLAAMDSYLRRIPLQQAVI